MSKVLVTITPPTPNGDLHLGHLAGPFLAADICTRLLRLQGHEALLLSYSDDYQSYLLRRARETGRWHVDIATANAAAIQRSMRSVDIQVDHFLQAHGNPYFLSEVNRYFNLIEDLRLVETRQARIPYCEGCKVFGYEGFGRATCNYCGRSSDASQCEACAAAPEVAKMGPMHCMLCKGRMAPVAVEQLAWKLGESFARLRGIYGERNLRKDLREYLARILSEPQTAWPLTRAGEEAIPLDRHPRQPIHTWFAGLAGYRATLREFLTREGRGETVTDWWNPSVRMAHFLGYDCSFSHAVAYRALLDLERTAPSTVYPMTNRFLKLDGKDFSTSRNHAIWIRDVSTSYPVDATRFYTALHAPENAVANFDRGDFARWVEAAYLPRFVREPKWTGVNARLPAPHGEALGSVLSILADWHDAAALEGFSIARLAAALESLLQYAERDHDGSNPYLWSLYSVLGEPVHPRLSRQIAAVVHSKCPHAAAWSRAVMSEQVHDVQSV